MPNRNVYDLSTYVASCGVMSHLQTLMTLPVIAGDSIAIDFFGAMKLADLKRYITLDAKIDLFAFFVSHRSVYGDDWETLIKEGLEQASATTLATINTGTATSTPCCYMGSMPYTGNTPKAYTAGYNKIWNNFCRVPNVSAELAETYVPTDGVAGEPTKRKYGFPMARLPEYWNTGADKDIMDATNSAEVALNTGNTQVSLLDISRVQSEYRDAVDKEWFSHRYRDVLEYGWGSNGVSIDSDERPQLLWSEETWTSGYNVDGTSGDSFGQLGGRQEQVCQLRMPSRFFNEHGMIWLMCTVRFPSILQTEMHYLMNHAWDYATISGDPNLALTTPPENLTMTDFTSAGSLDMGKHPSYQYWRTSPSGHIHRNFWSLEGFPFIDADLLTADVGGTDNDITYGDTSDFWKASTEDDYFNGRDLGHWSIIGKAEIEAKRVIPEATKSIYTGAHLR